MANGMSRIGGAIAKGAKGTYKGGFKRSVADVAEEAAAKAAASKVIPEATQGIPWWKIALPAAGAAGLGGLYMMNRNVGTGAPVTPEQVAAIQGVLGNQQGPPLPPQGPPLPPQGPTTVSSAGTGSMNPVASPISRTAQAIQTAPRQVHNYPLPQAPVQQAPSILPQQASPQGGGGPDWTSISNILGQLGQAVTAGDPTSLGYQLGGIATRAAQAQLYNRYLGQLISGGGRGAARQGQATGGQGGQLSQTAPNFPQLSALESFGLSPEMQQAGIKQLEDSRSADVDRLYKLGLMTGIETPEQLLRRQLIMAAISRQPKETNLQRVSINKNPEGKTTGAREKHLWNIDPTTGQLQSYIGPDTSPESGGGSGGSDISTQYRQNDKSARQLALSRLKLKYPESIIKNPVTGEFDIGFVPPGSNLLEDFNNEYLTSIRFMQSQAQLPPGWEQIVTGVQGSSPAAPGVAQPTPTGKPKY